MLLTKPSQSGRPFSNGSSVATQTRAFVPWSTRSSSLVQAHTVSRHGVSGLRSAGLEMRSLGGEEVMPHALFTLRACQRDQAPLGSVLCCFAEWAASEDRK